MGDRVGSQELEELLEDLQDDYGSVETLPKEVERLLQELHSGEDFLSRHHAAATLGRIGTEYPKVRRALRAASESDPHGAVRRTAAQALRACEEKERSSKREAEGEAEEKPRQVARESIRPRQVQPAFHIDARTEGDALRLYWNPYRSDQGTSALIALGVLIVSIATMVGCAAGKLPGCMLPAGSAFAAGSAYWIVAVMTSHSSVTATPDEWVFRRGPWPLPDRRFYRRTTRLDPASCSSVFTTPVETKRRKMSGSNTGGADSVAAIVFLAVIEAIFWVALAERETITTHTVYARMQDGEDRELVSLLSSDEAAFLEQKLRRLLADQVADHKEAPLRSADQPQLPADEAEIPPAEPLTPVVQELLDVVESDSSSFARRDAAPQLGKVPASDPRIVRGRIAASESDPNAAVRRAAAQALRAPGHQELLLEQPDLIRETERSGSELSRAPLREDVEDMVLSRRRRVRILALVYGLVVVAVAVLLFAFRQVLPTGIRTSLLIVAAAVWPGGTVLGLVVLRSKGYAGLAEALELLGSGLFEVADSSGNEALSCVLLLILGVLCVLGGPVVLITALLLDSSDSTRRRSPQ